ncbi:MAG: hypothetical protein EHM61_04015 [Acidobacteria bacterium]|nr:MAG: hypothetical protein EHM61_04015 [Acidobacteriota bacterium]
MRAVNTHAGGIANVWLNMVKLLIGLVFAYQQVLSDQLGLSSLLNLDFEVLTLGEVHVHQVKTPNDVIDVPFVPISREKYTRLDVTVRGIDQRMDDGTWRSLPLIGTDGPTAFCLCASNDQTRRNYESEELPKISFSWPDGGVGARAIRVANFSLSALLCPDDVRQLGEMFATGNQTEVQYKLHYDTSAEYEGRRTTVFEGSNEVVVAYQLPGASRRGYDMSIVEGQSAPLPPDLRVPGAQFQTAGLNIRDARVIWSRALRVGNQVPFDGTCTDAAGDRWEFTLRVFGVENKPPRQIRGDYVGLVYPLNQYNDPYAPAGYQRWSFQISDYIVDPDGIGPNGPDFGRYRLELSTDSFRVNGQQRTCPYLVAPFGTNQWRLYRSRNSGVPVPGTTESLMMRAWDSEGKEQRIEVRIVS